MINWDQYANEFNTKVEPVLEWMHVEFNKIRVGRANPTILNDIFVEAYDEKTHINQIANINTPEPRILTIKPYDRSLLKNLASAISAANIGINPQVDGDLVRLTFPAPTEESRKECLKKVKLIAEEAKVGVRKIRQDLQDEFKKDPDAVEDDKKYFQTELDNLTREINKKIDLAVDERNEEIMTI